MDTLAKLNELAVALEALKGQLTDIIVSLTPPTSDETSTTSGEVEVEAAADTTTGDEVAPVETTNPEGTAEVTA